MTGELDTDRVQALREFEVHHARWDTHEMERASDPTALLTWLPDEILDHVLPTRRTLRAHFELVRSEQKRILREREERLMAARSLTTAQLWRRVDPLKIREDGSPPTR